MATASNLQDLVDSPNETLDVEYKSWLDLKENEARADLARHLAALANHGGGYVVFGFTDDLAFAGANPFGQIDRDIVSGIVKRYLEPPFQCEVQIIRSTAGNDHTIIVVPPHGATPVCAKAGGPIVDGKQRGIAPGTHYVRKPGPASEAALTPTEWGAVIRRCAMHERASILGALDAALRGSNQTVATLPQTLQAVHDAARSVFLSDAARMPWASTQVSGGHFQLSYAIARSDSGRLDANDLIETLRQVNREVEDLVRTGWSMFHIFVRPEIEPRWTTDPSVGNGEEEFLECAHLRDTRPIVGAIDMWRISPDGKATLLRPYFEDGSDVNGQHGLSPGTWFSPNHCARDLAEFVRHARGVTERFSSPTSIAFRCEWHGLTGRRFHDLHGRWSPGRTSQRNHVVTTRTWPVASLTTARHEVTAELMGPLARAFGNLQFPPEWFLQQAPNWLRM